MNTATFKKPRKSSSRHEQNEHVLLSKYLKLCYPKLLFSTDLSGAFLTKTEAGLAKAMRTKDFKVPDITIYENLVSFEQQIFVGGLYIELKKTGQRLKQVKNPEKWFDEHFEKQAYSLAQLNENGKAGFFCVGYDAAKAVIDAYLSKKMSVFGKLLSNEHPSTGKIYRPLLCVDKFPLFNHV